MASRSRSFNFPLLAAGILGLSGVALGAMGAHALKSTLLERGTLAAWDTAAKYHLLHAVALLAVASWVHLQPAGSRLLDWAVRCWCLGVFFFSGSIYWLALGGPRWLGPVTPLGGVAFMVGWLLVALLAFSKGKQEE